MVKLTREDLLIMLKDAWVAGYDEGSKKTGPEFYTRFQRKGMGLAYGEDVLLDVQELEDE